MGSTVYFLRISDQCGNNDSRFEWICESNWESIWSVEVCCDYADCNAWHTLHTSELRYSLVFRTLENSLRIDNECSAVAGRGLAQIIVL